jgi:RyR domain
MSTIIYEACARAAHEVNRAYCRALGDDSLSSWDDAPIWQKTSILNGVRGVLLDKNTPEQSHERWLEEKKATGWKFGLVKNPETKEHPCFVPYNELPLSQQAKDVLFVTTVREMAKALGVPGAATKHGTM